MKAIKYTKELLEEAVKSSVSYAGVVRYLGARQAGGTQSYIAKRVREFSIDTSHFTGQAWNRGGVARNRKDIEEILVKLPKGSNRPKVAQLKRAMKASGVDEICACGQGKNWNGRPLTLEVDHIDGDWLNNLLENLRFMCPNCHSQEETSNKPHKYRNNTP